jgi:hypothetical protein
MARPLKFNYPVLIRLTKQLWDKIKIDAAKKKKKPTELVREILSEKYK